MQTIAPIIFSIAGITFFTVIAMGIVRKFFSVIVVPMNHRCVHSRNGKFVGVLDSGRHRFFGRGHQFECFDDRLQQLTVQPQELITVEGITVKVTAVGLYRIVDPVMAISSTADFHATLYTLVQIALRDAIGGASAESLLSEVRVLGPKLLRTVYGKAVGLGLEVTELVVRDVILPTEIKSALSEAWRSKKTALAEIEAARGKAAAARTFANAAKLYEANPVLLKIRYIEALEQASKGMGNTFVIGMPGDKTLHHL